MKNFSSLRKGGLLCLSMTFSTLIFSQAVIAIPQNIIRPFGANTCTISLNRIIGFWGDASSGPYVWSVSPTTGVTIGSYSQTNPNVADATATFSSAASGSYTFTLTRGSISRSVTVRVGNLAASTFLGLAISAFNVANGSLVSGPGVIFFPQTITSAIAMNAAGYFYYLPGISFGNDGEIQLYAANPNGSGVTVVASADINGASNNDLGFVRLCVDLTGTGWILAGDNSQLYLASFNTNGINPTTIDVVDPSVTVVNGNVSTFYNGDICFTGSGTFYALANTGNGVTQVFTGIPNGTSTTLTKKWDLVDHNGNAFTGSVNGVAFDPLGSLYISSSAGLGFIDQNTVNTATGTVQVTQVQPMFGLTDLASNFHPLESALPVTLLSFGAVYRDPSTLLNWETAEELNFDRFEVERSVDGSGFETIGTKPAIGTPSSRQSYQLTDDLTNNDGRAFTYRLKMVDVDGRFKYSQVVLVRKDAANIKGITLNPNPVPRSGSATIRFTAARSGKASLRAVDLSGKTIWQQQVQVYTGANSVSFVPDSKFPSGTYVLQVQSDGEVQDVKFTIAQ